MKKKNSGKELLQKLGTLMALALLVLIFCVMMPDKFPRISNIMNIFKQASINCLIASGMLCALITAGIDLSVGSNCVLCTCTIGVLVQNFGITSMPLLIIAGLAVSTFAGFVNGILRVFSDGEQEVVGHGEKGELSFCLKRLAGAARHRCLAFMVGFALSRIPYPHGPPAPTRLPEREAPARGSLDRGMASDVVSSIPGIQILTVDVGKN